MSIVPESPVGMCSQRDHPFALLTVVDPHRWTVETEFRGGDVLGSHGRARQGLTDKQVSLDVIRIASVGLVGKHFVMHLKKLPTSASSEILSEFLVPGDIPSQESG